MVYDPSDRLVTMPEVQKRLALSRDGVYNLIARDATFPRPLKLGGRSIRWSAAALATWIAEKHAAMNPAAAKTCA